MLGYLFALPYLGTVDSAVSTNSEGDGAKGVKEPNAAGDRSADAANEAAVEGTDASKESVPSDEVGAFNVTLILPGVLAPVDAMVSGRCLFPSSNCARPHP